MKKVFIVTHIWNNESAAIMGVFSELHLAENRKKEVEKTLLTKYGSFAEDEHRVNFVVYTLNVSTCDILIQLPWQH